jgi:POT family proton-dependent oligopeptide transporter
LLDRGLNALGELLVSGLGLAMIARYVPAHMSGFMMGAFFVATGVSQYLGSVVANFAQLPAHELDPVQSLPLYTKLFDGLGWLAAGGAGVRGCGAGGVAVAAHAQALAGASAVR